MTVFGGLVRVLEGVITPEAIHEWTTALKYGQQLNDRLLLSDWRQIDWQALGRIPSTKSLTTDEINHVLGKVKHCLSRTIGLE